MLHKDKTEDIRFDPAWDKDAFTVDLHPGMAANWPLHGPHRIENQSGVNVSVPFEISTPQSRLQNSILYANGVLRRQFGYVPKETRTDGVGAVLKRLLTLAVKLKIRLFGDTVRPMPKSERTFDIDPNAPDGFVDRRAA